MNNIPVIFAIRRTTAKGNSWLHQDGVGMVPKFKRKVDTNQLVLVYGSQGASYEEKRKEAQLLVNTHGGEVVSLLPGEIDEGTPILSAVVITPETATKANVVGRLRQYERTLYNTDIRDHPAIRSHFAAELLRLIHPPKKLPDGITPKDVVEELKVYWGLPPHDHVDNHDRRNEVFGRNLERRTGMTIGELRSHPDIQFDQVLARWEEVRMNFIKGL